MPVYNPIRPSLPPDVRKNYSLRRVLLLVISLLLIGGSGLFFYLAFRTSPREVEKSVLPVESDLKTSNPKEKKSSKPTTSPTKPGKIYRVEAGDTLFLIGQKFKVDWHKIATYNNLKEPYTIKVGQELIIPEAD